MVDSSTQRWIRSEADEKAVARGCHFDEEKALHVVEFFSHLRQTIGQWAGQPLELMDWQRDDVIMPLFGWMGPDGRRRYRVAYIEIPKKNGKSTLCSAIALYLLAGDGEPGAEVYCAASDRNQAGIVYRQASAMARGSPLLASYIVPSDSVKNLALPSTNSFFRAISRDAYSAEGMNIHGLVFDELHAQKTRELWDALRYGGASRRQPLIIAITTAGYDRTSICWEQHERARKLLDGSIEDDTFFAYVRAADDRDDWKDPEVWRKANPSYDVTFSGRDFESAFREALDSPTKENAFKRYRLNIWTSQSTRWIQVEKWLECAADIDLEDLEEYDCYGGLDLASVSDLAAFVLLFVVDDRYRIVPHFFIPEDTAIEREQREGISYHTWSRQGFVTLTPGNQIQFDSIEEKIIELHERFSIMEIAFDDWNCRRTAQRLEAEGFEMVRFGQTHKEMNEPSKLLERLILTKRIDHPNNPVLNWCIDNVEIKQDPSGNYKPVKPADSRKIDGVVALIMALGRAMLRDDQEIGHIIRL